MDEANSLAVKAPQYTGLTTNWGAARRMERMQDESIDNLFMRVALSFTASSCVAAGVLTASTYLTCCRVEERGGVRAGGEESEVSKWNRILSVSSSRQQPNQSTKSTRKTARDLHAPSTVWTANPNLQRQPANAG